MATAYYLDGAGVSVLLGNGDGTFQSAVTCDAGGRCGLVAVGDFNGDGKPDLAVQAQSPFRIGVLLGNGDGTFQTAVTYDVGPNGSSAECVAVGDFRDDGQPDLAVAKFDASAQVAVLLNTCVSAGPSLSISFSNATLTLSWPFPSAGSVLESTPSLSPSNWQPAPESAVTNNGLLEVLVPIAPGSRYFRLHKP